MLSGPVLAGFYPGVYYTQGVVAVGRRTTLHSRPQVIPLVGTQPLAVPFYTAEPRVEGNEP